MKLNFQNYKLYNSNKFTSKKNVSKNTISNNRNVASEKELSSSRVIFVSTLLTMAVASFAIAIRRVPSTARFIQSGKKPLTSLNALV